ncbi:hypothetical protein AB0G86_05935 [Streptomyces scabiei]|uniref:hypothetical protein n=1 Tax=Streptomyces scabiei TaxID=1930 RepID=UPI0033E496D5
MTLRSYFGFAEPAKDPFTTQRRSRLRVAVATGTAATLGLMAVTIASPASADPTYLGYEGPTYRRPLLPRRRRAHQGPHG